MLNSFQDGKRNNKCHSRAEPAAVIMRCLVLCVPLPSHCRATVQKREFDGNLKKPRLFCDQNGRSVLGDFLMFAEFSNFSSRTDTITPPPHPHCLLVPQRKHNWDCISTSSDISNDTPRAEDEEGTVTPEKNVCAIWGALLKSAGASRGRRLARVNSAS